MFEFRQRYGFFHQIKENVTHTERGTVSESRLLSAIKIFRRYSTAADATMFKSTACAKSSIQVATYGFHSESATVCDMRPSTRRVKPALYSRNVYDLANH